MDHRSFLRYQMDSTRLTWDQRKQMIHILNNGQLPEKVLDEIKFVRDLDIKMKHNKRKEDKFYHGP